jgi:hypothetical protein
MFNQLIVYLAWVAYKPNDLLSGLPVFAENGYCINWCKIFLIWRIKVTKYKAYQTA